MKNLFIQKIILNKEVNNKPSLYLLTINKNIKLEKVKIMGKNQLIEFLQKELF